MDKFQAYLIGLAQTDGHLRKNTRNRGAFQIEIQYADIDILKRIASLVDCNYKIGERTRNTNFKDNYRSASLTIHDWGFRTFLNENGVPYGKKSGTVKPAFGINDELVHEYMRGLIDGDGSLGITAGQFPFVGFTTYSEHLKVFYINYVKQHVSYVFSDIQRNARDNIYQLTIYKEDAQKFASQVYYDGCMAIQRKYEKAELVKKWVRPAYMKKIDFERKRWEPWEDEVVLGNSNEVATKILGRTYKSVNVRRCRLNKKVLDN